METTKQKLKPKRATKHNGVFAVPVARWLDEQASEPTDRPPPTHEQQQQPPTHYYMGAARTPKFCVCV